MAITTPSALLSAFNTAQRRSFLKTIGTGEAAGTFSSLWKVGGLPSAGATPSNTSGLNGSIPTDATLGAFSFTNPTAPAISNILRFGAVSTIAMRLIVYDRLWHNSGMSGTQTTVDTTLSTPADLTRPDANGAGTELWHEVYTAVGATVTTLNVRYTNQDGTTLQQATGAFPPLNTSGAPLAGVMGPMTLASGDTGIRKATAYHLTASTTAAGDFGLVIMRRLLEIPISAANIGAVMDFAACGMPQVYDDSCIAMMVLLSATTAATLTGDFHIGQG